MKGLNKFLIIILLFFNLSFTVNCQNSLKKIQIEYLDFEKIGGSSKLKLIYFKIKNNTKDTLYLSNKNIKFNVLKNGKQLKDEEYNSRGQIVFKPLPKNKAKIDKEEEHHKKTAKLKHNFAKKTFYKNFGNNKYKTYRESIIRNIENACIVILPNESINCSKLFNNVLFDKTCNVDIKYANNKIFTYFVDGEKVVNINY
jgi:hypothetical protein